MSLVVERMFDRLACRYDLTNRVLSLGIDLWWRAEAARALGRGAGGVWLDAATGTGDLARLVRRRFGRTARVVGVDLSRGMLEAAPAAVPGIEWRRADVQDLPFADDLFDGATIAFGIRNVDDPVAGLAELRRVVRPGGAVVVLEFGQPVAPFVGPLFRLYSSRVMPRIGGLLTGDAEAYRYLVRTSAAFPCGRGFLDLMTRAGLPGATARPLTGGVAWLYRGVA